MADIAPRRADRKFAQRNAELLDLLRRCQQLLHALFLIRFEILRRNFAVIGDAHVHDARARVGKNRADVIGSGVAVGLTVLRHDVQHVAFERLRARDRLRNAVDQEVRNDACV